MKVYLLDWQGTLDRLEDPVVFVKAVEERGDIAILHTGNPYGTNPLLKAVKDVCTTVQSKGNLRELFEALAHDPEALWTFDFDVPEEVVIVDDNPPDPDYVKMMSKIIPSRVVGPEDMLKELQPA